MRSLRRRLALIVAAGTALPLLAGAVALRLTVTDWLVGEFDTALASKASALVTLTRREAGTTELHFADEFMPEYSIEPRQRPARGAPQPLRSATPTLEPEYFQLWIDGGVELERSHSLGRAELPREPASIAAGSASAPRFADLVLPDGRRGRRVQIDFEPQVEDEVEGEEPPSVERVSGGPAAPSRHVATLVVARGREELDRGLRLLDAALAVFVAITLAVMAILIRPALRLGLRPLDELGRQVERLDADRLESRLHVPGLPVELAPLAARLDQLLDRLGAALERERRFSSNVAHELRTPIAELRALAEVGQTLPERRETVEAFFQDVQDIAVQMERIVDQLLALALHETSPERPPARPLSLADALDRAWSRHQRQAGARAVTLVLDLPADTVVVTDREKLDLILSNLLENAIAYSPPGSAIECRVAPRSPDRLMVELANPTHDLEPTDVERVFERFWRKDESRTGGRSFGLGLPLVKAVSENLGIEISVALDRGIFRVTLAMPRVP